MLYVIRVDGTDISFPCKDNEFIIRAMMVNREGPISHGCCGGGCGICKMKVVSGSVNIVKKMSKAHVSDEERAQGYALICCIQPCSDVVLERVD